jgi:hypothetical protein
LTRATLGCYRRSSAHVLCWRFPTRFILTYKRFSSSHATFFQQTSPVSRLSHPPMRNLWAALMLDPRNFNYDWQFLRDFFRIYYLRYLVQWFAIVPLVLVALADMPDRLAVRVTQNQYFIVNFALPFTWWLLWLSSVLYIIGWILYVLFGPAFIRRYTNYGAYQVLQHSERWIIWEWYYFLKRSAQATDVDDLIEKQLAAQCNLPPSLSDHKWQENCGKQLQITKPKKRKGRNLVFI